MATAASRIAGQFAEYKPELAQRDSILAGFITGLTLVEHAILGGYNVQAAALVRQELEAIAALQEIRLSSRKDGRTPNVRHVPSVPGGVYGDLSNAAHFSDAATLQELTAYCGVRVEVPGPTAVWLLSPQHRAGWTHRVFATHVLLLLHFAEHQADHYYESYGVQSTNEEARAIEQAIALLRQAGMIVDSA